MNSVEPETGKKPVKITGRHLLLVEGKDEELFFRALITSELSERASGSQVIPLGKDRFKPRLAGIAADIRTREVKSVGVVRDADESAAGALQSVCDALAAAGFAKPGSHGDIVGANPRVGIFVMPNGQSPGALEALCRQSVETGTAGSCVTEYLRCLSERGGWGDGAEHNTAQIDKAFVHAFLASRGDPVARTGEGAQQNVWCFQHEAFGALRDFLVRLTTG